MDWWNANIQQMSDDEFVQFIEQSRFKRLLRPLGVPMFDDLQSISAFGVRVKALFESSNTELQKRVRNLLFPIKRGAHKKWTAATLAPARRLRAELLPKLRTVHRTSRTMKPERWRISIEAVIAPLRIAPSAAKRDRLFEQLHQNLKPSEQAAIIAAFHHDVPWTQVLRGRVPRAPKKRPSRATKGERPTQPSGTTRTVAGLTVKDSETGVDWFPEQQRRRHNRDDGPKEEQD
jgi:hypothetical protein